MILSSPASTTRRGQIYLILGVAFSLVVIASAVINLFNLHYYHEIKAEYRIGTCLVTNCQELSPQRLSLDLTPTGWPFLTIPTTKRARQMLCRHWNGTTHTCQYFTRDPTKHCSLKLLHTPNLALTIISLIVTLTGGIPLIVFLFTAGCLDSEYIQLKMNH